MMQKRNFWTFILAFLFAISAFAADDDPQSKAYYHFLMGAMKESTRQYSVAIDEYKEALKYDPDASEIFSRLAYLYIQTNRMEEAIAEAQKAIQKNPDNKEAHRMLGQIHMEQAYVSEDNKDDLKAAITEFNEVHRIDPDDDGAMLS